jgi:hypothetical protein
MALGTGMAAADAPARFEDFIVEDFVNPCTGEEGLEWTTYFDVSVHEDHKNNWVLHTKRSGFTTDGFVSVNGTENLVTNKNGWNFGFMEMWVDPDTGDRFQIRGKLKLNFNNEEANREAITIRCL